MKKEEAKKYALEMWRWLRGHPTSEKGDFLEIHPDYPECFCNCALCQYVCEARGAVTTGGECAEYGCPLAHGEGFGCEKPYDSPYNRWKEPDKVTRQKAAKEIIALIEAW